MLLLYPPPVRPDEISNLQLLGFTYALKPLCPPSVYVSVKFQIHKNQQKFTGEGVRIYTIL